MRDVFISDLKNIQNFSGKFSALQQRGSAESCLMLMDGPPGLGKTGTTKWFRRTTGAFIIRAKRDWTPNWIYSDILESLETQGGKGRAFSRVVKAIAGYQTKQRTEGRVASLVIDEADHMIDEDGLLLETLRTITDTMELPTILVGMDRLHDAVSQWPQIARRITQRAHYRPLDAEDAALLINGLSEVEIKSDLVEHLTQKACIMPNSPGAFINEIVEGVGAIERFARRHGSGSVGRAEMKNVALFNDRVTGLPIRVEAPE